MASEVIQLAYRFRLYPTRAQHCRLAEALEHSRQLYNAALEERIDCYRKTGRGRSFMDQCRALTDLRDSEEFSKFPAIMQRCALQRVDRAFLQFFRRGGFPRFKGAGHFKTIGWEQRDGWRLRNGRFIAKGLGAIRVRFHCPLPSAPHAVKIKREGRHWFISFVCEVGCATANDNPAVGLDLGISALAALSTGEMIANDRPYRRAMRKLRIRQRALARCARGSKRRAKVRERLAAAHLDIRRARETYLHQVSADLTKRFRLIAVEALNVKGLASGILARDVRDASWGKLISMLRYKAERAGARLIEVDPRHTSQTCPECGEIKPKALSERVHSCPCGCVMDRDVAAAKVVLHRAVHGPGAPNVAGCGVRALGKAVAA